MSKQSEPMIPKHIQEKVEAEADKMESALIATGEGDEAQAHWLGVGCDVGAQFMYELLSPEIAELKHFKEARNSWLNQSMFEAKRNKSLEARIKDLRAALELIQGIMEGCYMKEGMVKMTDISLVAKAIEQDDKARGDEK